MVPHHGAGEIAAVEGVTGGDETRFSPSARGRLRFLVDQVLDGVTEVGLHETFAHPGRHAARKIDVPIRRPALVVVRMGNEVPVHQGMDRESLARVPNGG